MKHSLFNGRNDSVYLQVKVDRGVCLSNNLFCTGKDNPHETTLKLVKHSLSITCTGSTARVYL